MVALILFYIFMLKCSKTNIMTKNLHKNLIPKQRDESMETESIDDRKDGLKIDDLASETSFSENEALDLTCKKTSDSSSQFKNLITGNSSENNSENLEERNYAASNEPIDLSMKKKRSVNDNPKINYLYGDKDKNVEKRIGFFKNIPSNSKGLVISNQKTRKLQKSRGFKQKENKNDMLHQLNKRSILINKDISIKEQMQTDSNKEQTSERETNLTPTTHTDHSKNINTSTSDTMIFYRCNESKIFSFLKNCRETILKQKINIECNSNSRQNRMIFSTLENMHDLVQFPLKIMYRNELSYLESKYMILMQGLIGICRPFDTSNGNNLLISDDIVRFFRMVQYDEIHKDFSFKDMINNSFDIESLPFYKFKNYSFYYNGYIKNYFKNIAIIFANNLTSYFKFVLTKNINRITNIPFEQMDVLNIRSINKKNTFKSIVFYVKLVQKAISNPDFQIICLLIPEFETVISCIMEEKVSLKDIKFVHFLIGFVLTKFTLLKANIKHELEKNNSKHTPFYLDSPLIKTFVTSTQTLMLIVLFEKVKFTLSINTFSALLLKNFLNYVSVRNIYRKDCRTFFFINFITESHFSSVDLKMLRCLKPDEEPQWNLNLDIINVEILSEEVNFVSNLANFLNISDKTSVEIIFEEVKETISKIQAYFNQLK